MTTIKEHTELLEKLRRIDRQGYKRYKELKGAYRFPEFTLFIDHVQGDPFAAPTRACAVVPVKGRIPEEFTGGEPERTAVEDFLGRRFKEVKRSLVKGNRGIGKSGMIDIEAGTQKVLKRNAVVIRDDRIEFRFVVGLPAAGRTILGKEAAAMFSSEIPGILQRTMQIPRDALTRFVHTVRDQAALRGALPERGLVAFVADGALLPRKSGVDDRPLTDGVPFKSPPSLRVTLSTPHSGEVSGMGIPKGVTLIVGGGFHGKSTLLNALQMGIYDHVPGDGRERVVTLPEAVKIRAADGRYIEKVDISPFIHDLPFGRDTGAFSTDNASGSTSQAAGIMEALEAGCHLLLMDEDTSATNFMIRDERMQRLVPREKEPITPFVDKVRQLYTDHGVSTILVMGGSGDYFDVADTVIMMDTYEPRDVTPEAREIVQHFPTRRAREGGESFGTLRHRVPLKSSFDPSRGRRDVKIDAKGLHTILFGHTPIDLKDMEQLADISQTRSIGYLIHYAAQRHLDGTLPLSGILDRVFEDLTRGGLDILLPARVGNLAMPRKLDVAQAINRMRSLRVAS